MILFKKSADLSRYLRQQETRDKKIGFVPTMGALHDGHISLVERSRTGNSITVCSIFVNPAQFNDPKDFEKYPVTIARDIEKLEAAGVDVLYVPTVHEVYPEGMPAEEHYDLGFLETILEGRFRPGHYQGVCMVMRRLLETVSPTHLYLGQKDYQQCMVIKKLTELMHADDKIQIQICPTQREDDGLAMSSRNLRLSKEDRKLAPAIFEVMEDIARKLAVKPAGSLRQFGKQQLEKKGFKVDYVEIADAETLESINTSSNSRIVILVAAFLNEVRLIDNLVVDKQEYHKA